MNLLIHITMPFGGYVRRVLLSSLSDLTDIVESSDFKGRIRLKDSSDVNNIAVTRLGRIMSGEVRPYRSFLAGNDYFGRVRLEYERPDLGQDNPQTFYLSLQVYSALGRTLEEHDARYRRIKSSRFSAVQSCRETANE